MIWLKWYYEKIQKPILRVCNFIAVFAKKVQAFSDGMKTMQDIEDDAVYVNMTGQSPRCTNFVGTKGSFLVGKLPCRKNILFDMPY
jgi:hypothetical protein